MDENLINSNSEACLQFIYKKFDYYKNILDEDQQACDQLIASIREQASLYTTNGIDTIELANQLDYFEEEAFKTHEENKTCLFKMIQHLFYLHRQYAFDDVLTHERRIAEAFQYRPSLLPNLEKLRLSINSMINNLEKNRLIFSATPTPKTSIPNSTSFSNRADIEAFQQKKEPISLKTSTIESNEIDLTKLIRDTYSNQTSEQFKFSKVAENWQQQQQKSNSIPAKKVIPKTKVPCDDALIMSANKRFVLLYNMNITSMIYIYDTQKDDTKEFQWEEDAIYSIGYVDSNTFCLITSSKIFLYDIIKETITKQYFLYDTLYKDLLLIKDDLSYKTLLKRNNQICSTVYDDYCYYIYTNKEYNQILIKLSLDTFQQDNNINLTKKFPNIEYFLDLTITPKSLITFLIMESNQYHLLFCDELHNYSTIKKIPINNSIDSTILTSTYSSNLKITSNNKTKIGKQVWFILDRKLNAIHCLTHDNYLTKISSIKQNSIQSITVYDNKLILGYNELTVDIINLDNYFASLKL